MSHSVIIIGADGTPIGEYFPPHDEGGVGLAADPTQGKLVLFDAFFVSMAEQIARQLDKKKDKS